MRENPVAVGIDFLGPLDSVHHHSFLLRVEDGRYLKVSQSTYVLLQLMDGTRNLAEIATSCREDWDLEIEEGCIQEIVKEKFIPNHLIRNGSTTRRRWFRKGSPSSSQRFGLVKLPVLPVSLVQKLATLITGLFKPKIMLSLGILSLIAHICFYLKYSPNQIFSEFRSYQYWFIPIVWSLVSVLHELGHAAACQYYGARPGAIGVGLYIVFPVFWSDLKAVWPLKRFQRAVVDIGGLYMEWILNIFLIIFAFTHYSPWISGLVVWGNIAMLYNLLPILRLDGYWLFSDLIGVPNLDEESRSARKSLLWNHKLPKIDSSLYGAGRTAFYLYIILSITVMPLILYRVWFFLIWIIRDLPQKIIDLQTLIEQGSTSSLWGALKIGSQVLVMLAMLTAWAISFVTPLFRRGLGFMKTAVESRKAA